MVIGEFFGVLTAFLVDPISWAFCVVTGIIIRRKLIAVIVGGLLAAGFLAMVMRGLNLPVVVYIAKFCAGAFMAWTGCWLGTKVRRQQV